jgi:two-component system cell cycle sensor histidine kinase/response regulator CckA
MSSSHDATERCRRLEERLRVLSEAMRAFADATGDPQRLLDAVAQRVAEVVKDFCLVLLVSVDGRALIPAAAFDPDPDALRQLRDAFSAPVLLEEHPVARRVHESGEPFFAPKLDPGRSHPGTTPRTLDFMRRIGMHSLLIVALRVHDRSIGQLVLGRCRPDSPPFDEHDLALARNLADHAAFAVSSGRLLAEARRESAERVRLADRLRIVTDAAHEFAATTSDYHRLLDVVARRVGDVVADACIVRLLSDGGWLTPAAIHLPLDASVVGADALARVHTFMAAPHNVAQYAWGRNLIDTGEAFVLPRLDMKHFRTIVTAEVADVYETIGVHSMLVVVLRVQGESIGTLTLFRFDPAAAPFDDGDRDLAQTLADHAALAIGNARSYAAERAAREAIAKLHAEEPGNEKARRLADIVDSSDDAIIGKTLEGVITSWNQGARRIFGYAADEVVGKPISLLIPPGREDEEPTILETLAKGEVKRFETLRRRKDGQDIEVAVTISPVRDATGCIVGISKVARDITDRKRTEEALARARDAAQAAALHASEVRFARLADSGLLGIALSDDGGAITDANDTYLRTLGYTREDLQAGRLRWAEMTPPEWIQTNARVSEQLARSGVTVPFEKEYFRKDGSRVPVLVGIATLDPPNNINFFVDLTERKKAEGTLRETENQLRQAQKMEAVGRLAGGVAHDFNNVLSVIMSYSEMALGDLKPSDPLRADMDEIHKAASRAAGLTRQLLLFSRQQVVEPRVLDLHEVLASMDKMLRRILGEDVEMLLLAPATTGRINADPSHLEQVIMNLVVNARDAMPTGGKLTIETANVVLDESYALGHRPAKAGPHVMLAVTDTGTGMDRETQTRIFEPFFTTKEKGKGTGLGLSTVFGIVQQSGGSVWVYSEPGKGTSFKIYLPRVDAEADAPVLQVPTGTLRGTETILLVEDEEQVRAVVLNVLRRQGYHVITTQNAGEALLLCERHTDKIDLLLTDVVMPGMSGPELARRLATSRPEMRVLCMSGYTDDSIVRHGVLDSGVAFLQKPVTPASLAKKVREVLDAEPTATTG